MTDILPNPTAFTSGLPWADASGFNNGSMDDVAINQAISALQRNTSTGHGIVYCPPGTYTFNNTVQPGNGIRIIGAGSGATVFVANADLPCVNLQGFESELSDVAVLGWRFGTLEALVVGAPAVRGRLIRVRASGGFNCVRDSGVDTYMQDCKFDEFYGNSAVHKDGGNCFYDRLELDCGFPHGMPALQTQWQAWQPGTYGPGSIVKMTGPGGQTYLLQTQNGGATGSQLPTIQPYGLPTIDGAVSWALVCNINARCLHVLDNAEQLIVSRCDMSAAGYYAGIWDEGSAQNLYHHNTIANQTIGVYVLAGDGDQFTDNTIQQGIRGANNLTYGILFQNTAGGSHGVGGNLIYGYDEGVYLNGANAGAGTVIHDNRIFSCGEALRSVSGVGGFTFSNNKCGASSRFGANSVAARVDGGGSNITMMGNDGRGSGAPSINQSGSNNIFTPNNW